MQRNYTFSSPKSNVLRSDQSQFNTAYINDVESVRGNMCNGGAMVFPAGAIDSDDLTKYTTKSRDNVTYTANGNSSASCDETTATINYNNLSNQPSLESNDGYMFTSSTGSGASSCETSTTKSVNDLISSEFDSGLRAWTVVLGSFLTNGLIFGLINSYGVIFDLIKDHFNSDSTRANLSASSIGSLAVGMTFFCSFISSILCESIGIRSTALLGAIIATLGLVAASFATSLIHMLLAYGILFGFGASLVYTPSLVILGHYFHKRLGLVNGVVTSGSSLFSIFMSFGLTFLVKQMTFQQIFLLLAGLISLLIFCALTFVERKLPMTESANNLTREQVDQQSTRDIWKNKMYLIWIIAVPLGLFGYFIPYYNLVGYFKTIDKNVNEATPVILISACSGLGRLIFGNIADSSHVNAIFLQQVAFVSIGLLTLFLIVAKDALSILIICAGLGLFDGCFISVLGPIAYTIVGRAGASKAVGFLLAACSFPLTVGPIIGGYLTDLTGTYSYVFLYSGIWPIAGALLLSFVLRGIHCRGSYTPREIQVAIPQVESQTLKFEVKPLLINNSAKVKY